MAVDEQRQHIFSVFCQQPGNIQPAGVRDDGERFKVLPEFINQPAVQINAPGIAVEIGEIQPETPVVPQVGGNFKNALVPSRAVVDQSALVPLPVC